jgi:REP element-mobilizing transposase RayT
MIDQDRNAIGRRRSIRLPAFDYTSAGAYFVTVVTAKRACVFGEVVADICVLGAAGAIVDYEWRKTAEIRDSMELDEFVVMPNHLHGIVWITDETDAPTEQGTPPRAPTTRRFGQPVSKSLSIIINNFKGRVTTRARELTGIADQAVWQRGFYERIIRDETELLRIREYVIANPRLWAEDEENPARKV